MVSTGRVERTMLMRTQESSEISSPSSIIHRKEEKPIVINGRDAIRSVAILADGKHIVGGDGEMIRRWRIEDGKEVGTPMDAEGDVLDIAVSRNGKRIVSGTTAGQVAVWNAESRSKLVTRFNAHDGHVRAVDVSPDATKIVTGSSDNTASGRSRLAENCWAPCNTTTSWWQQSFHPTAAKSRLSRGTATPSGSMTVGRAASSSIFQSGSSRR